MKKIITTLVLAAMLLATFVVAASAETYLENEPCQINFEIKKADPAYVVKDGVISAGEYEKVEFDKADLAINFAGSGCWMTADAMADTVEYYFSWDEVHGLNFAVRYDAYPLAAGQALGYPADQIINGCKTTMDQPGLNEKGVPMDNFLFNTGINFASGWDANNKNHVFYYAIGKKIGTTDGYLTGHWGQLGPDGVYEAVGGKDFEISYNGTVVTAEWSIPFVEFDYAGATAGSQLAFTIVATAGAAEAEDPSNASELNNAKSSWGVSLGQMGFMVQQARKQERAKATLVADVIPSPCTHSNTTNVDAVPATCQSTGYTAGVYCNDCNKYISGHEEVPISSTNHVNTTNVDAVPATCQSTGFTAGVYCNDCETYISGHEEIPVSSNHTYGEWFKFNIKKHKRICICGDVQYEDHDWNSGVVIESPTCTAPGIINYKQCHICAEILIEQELIPPLGHDYSEEWTVDKTATATEKGVKSRHCSRCDSVTDVIEYVDSSLIFDDVKANKWYTSAIDYSVLNGLMNGVSSTRFDLNGMTTRAMVVTILYRLEGSPDVSGQVPFTDIKADWYNDAVLWAYNNDIVKGISATKFDPNAPVTREQIATILYRYAEFKGYDTTARADFSELPDANLTHTWAKEALEWAYAEELITGTTSNGVVILDPRGDATRAQVATIVMRFLENKI